jgi:hypothetical protein
LDDPVSRRGHRLDPDVGLVIDDGVNAFADDGMLVDYENLDHVTDIRLAVQALEQDQRVDRARCVSGSASWSMAPVGAGPVSLRGRGQELVQGWLPTG